MLNHKPGLDYERSEPAFAKFVRPAHHWAVADWIILAAWLIVATGVVLVANHSTHRTGLGQARHAVSSSLARR